MKLTLSSVVMLVLLMISVQGCLPVVAAGVGTGLMMAKDRRSNEAFIQDQKLELKISGLIDRDFHNVMHVNVTSFNHRVLLTGEVPEVYAKAELSKMIARINQVRGLENELIIATNESLGSRSKDSLITSNVKLRFLNNDYFNAEHVKVVTENGTVYLLGIVKRAEGKAAADIASTTKGVQRVVKLFEYMD